MLDQEEKIDHQFRRQGDVAYWAGKPKEANPHAAGFRNAEMWDTGWEEGRARDLEYLKEGQRRKQAKEDKQKRNAANRLVRAEAARMKARKK